MKVLNLNTVKSIVILSPHIDDAFLSMGGTIHYAISNDIQVTVLNIFSKSVFSVTNLPKNKVEETRIFEEKENKKIILDDVDKSNASLELVFLGLPDAGLRGFDDENIYDYPRGNFTNYEDYKITREEIIQIEETLKSYQNPGTFFFVPSCLGNHIDHNLVKNIFMKNNYKTNSFLNYTEMPYSLVEDRSYSFFQPISFLIKSRLISSYSSQLYEIETLVKDIKKFSKINENDYVEFFY